MVLSRQSLPVLDPQLSAPGATKGGYVLADASDGEPEVVLLATGSEVSLALESRQRLVELGISTRVVSMPSWEIFEEQDQAYRDQVIPPAVPSRVAVEAASPMGWWRYVGSEGAIVGMTGFGASGAAPELFEHFGITAEAVAERARSLLAQRGTDARSLAGHGIGTSAGG